MFTERDDTKAAEEGQALEGESDEEDTAEILKLAKVNYQLLSGPIWSYMPRSEVQMKINIFQIDLIALKIY